MAVALEFIDIIIRADAIRQKFPHGWSGFLADFEDLIGATVWFDDHLVRTGAMSAADIEMLVEFWGSQGLDPYRKLGENALEWTDLCVSQGIGRFAAPTARCDWIAYDEVSGGAFRKGTEPAVLVGPVR